MKEMVLIQLAAVIVLGIGAQWLAWRFKLPSILLLLLIGLFAGPVTGLFSPDELMGDLLFPVVSLSVAVILFEGGLTLKLAELRQVGLTVLSVISLGAVIAWLCISTAAYYLLGLNIDMAVLLGAILVVTGPTVVGPLLRHIRPQGRVAEILKWEGIVIDPVGALLAVLVFEVIVSGGFQQAGEIFLLGIGKTILVGGLVGGLGAWILVVFIQRFWIPDYLEETVTLAMVIAAYVVSDLFQEESGLLATTIMGLVMGNQKKVAIKQILDFKENLQVLILSVLFIMLAARLTIADIRHFSFAAFLFLTAVIFVARPVSVFVSTLITDLSFRERLFLSWMAPRGIVAAAVSSIFAIRLKELNFPQSEYLVPMTFLVIIVTVVVYGLTAKPLARKLGLAQQDPQGALLFGADPWVLDIAERLLEYKIPVLVVDSNWSKINHARLAGIPAYHGNILAEGVLEELPLNGIGKFLALTSNEEANSLAVLHFSELFDRQELYQLLPDDGEVGRAENSSAQHLRGRYLFRKDVNHHFFVERHLTGAVVKATLLTDEFDFQAFRKTYGTNFLPLFLITETGRLLVFALDEELTPLPGQILIALIDRSAEEKKG